MFCHVLDQTEHTIQHHASDTLIFGLNLKLIWQNICLDPKEESQGGHTAGNLSTFGFLLYDSALCLDPLMKSSLTNFGYRAL